MTKPSLLIATPAYGGLFTRQYVDSLLETWDWLGQEQIPVGKYFIENESLITRARNTLASYALKHEVSKLLFIDADVGWSPSDVSKLYYSEKKIIGGLYPHKTYPITLNANGLQGEKADEKGETKVRHIATGFLLIDLSVLQALAKITPTYLSTHLNGTQEIYYDFFRCGAGIFTEGEYVSEDWYFCEMAAKLGYESYANASVVLTHTGTHTFRSTT